MNRVRRILAQDGPRPVGPALTYAGVALVVAGFVLILYTWGRVAGLANVALQLPYVVSGGLSALALILTGLTLVIVNAKRQDLSAAERELTHLRDAVAELTVLLGAPARADALPQGDGERSGGDDRGARRRRRSRAKR